MTQRLNLMSPEVRANPYPFYAQLRRDSPVAQVDPGGLWAVSRYEDVMHVLKNPKIFSSEGFKFSLEPPWFGRPNPLSDSILLIDDPKHHGRLRGLVNRAFGPTALARLEPRIRATAREGTTRLLSRQTVDFVQDFALPLPASVIGTLLGLDPALHSRFKQWSDDLAIINVTRPGDTELLAQCRRTIEDMEQYLNEVITSRRKNPSDDMVSGLIQAQAEGDVMTDKELMGFLFLLLAAGLETTVHLLGHSARHLADHPDLLARLRADRSLIPQFVEEMIRFEPPVHGLFRLCKEEVTLGGTTLSSGSVMVLLLASAARDESYAADADRFSLDRKGPSNIPFGYGAHFCLGAPLARLEARVALEELLPRCAGLVRAPEPLEWNQSLTVRGMRKLPLEVREAG